MLNFAKFFCIGSIYLALLSTWAPAAHAGPANAGTNTGLNSSTPNSPAGPDPDLSPIHLNRQSGPKIPPNIKPELPEIDTDRPDITDSPLSVPPGFLVAENECFINQFRKSNDVTLPSSILRFGLFNRNELRIGVPSYIRESIRPYLTGEIETSTETIINPETGEAFIDSDTGEELTSSRSNLVENQRELNRGVSDMSIGWKYQIGPIGKVDIAAIPEIVVPTGSGFFRSKTVDPSIRFPYGFPVGKNWEMGGMQGFFLTSDSEGNRLLIWQPVFLLERELGEKANIFMEYAADFPTRGKNVQFLHFGAAYRPRRSAQLETHFGIGLNRETPTIFYAFGYSFMLGPFWGRDRFRH